MKLKLILWLTSLALLCSATWAQAGSCTPFSVSAANATIAYVPSNPTVTVSSALNSTCSAKTGGNNDVHPISPVTTGIATSGGNTINFTLSTTAACPGSAWNALNPITFSYINSGSSSSTFYICIATGQNVAAGTYTNTVSLNDSATPTGNSFTITIFAPASCTFSTPPGTVNFGSYTAFSGAALTANTTFRTTCTNTLPYVMSLDGTNTYVMTNGLQYSLLLDTTSSSGSNTLNSTGTGLTQSFFINGSMPAGQAGTCASATCASTDSRTLTVTY